MQNHRLRHVRPGKTALALLVLVMASAAADESTAAEYFVSRSGDNGDGLSEKTAFTSIGKGVALLKPGDTLTILPGTYFETISARISGTPAAPIVIRAARPSTVLIRGDVDAPRFRPAEGRLFTFCADFEKRVEGVAERSTLRIYEPMLSLAEVELTPASFYQEPEAVCVHTSDAKGTAQESHATGRQAGRLYVHTSDSAHPDCHALSISVTNGFGILLTPPPGSATVHDVVIDGLGFTGYQAREFPPEPGSRNRWGLHVVMGERVAIRRCTAFLNIRLNHLENLRSDHNAYFARMGPAERRLVETAKIGGKPVGHQAPGTYRGVDLLLADVQRQAGQEKNSAFGNPGIRVVKELLPSGAPQGEWQKVEMHWDGQAFRPWDFADFLADPTSPLARAADGKPRGLDPAAFP